MEVYVQEIWATIFFPHLPSAVMSKVLGLASAFLGLLTRMRGLVDASIPPDTWYFFLQQIWTDGNDGKFLEDEVKAWHHARLREPIQNKARVKQERKLSAAANVSVNRAASQAA